MNRATHNRAFLRAATRIHECLKTTGDGAVPELPLAAWQELQATHSRLALAVDRSWRAAAAQLRQELGYAASYLIRRLDECTPSRPSLDHTANILSAHDIYLELDALRDEFDDVRIDMESHTLTVVTERVILDDQSFGHFEIVLDWNQFADDQAYTVVAIDPNPASVDSAITHPHVRDGHLCEGNGRLPIRRALEQGRLSDFLPVRQILETYNEDSAYVQLEHWHGSDCRDCGRAMGQDDSTSCERCDAEMCADCSSSCPDCGVSCCSECRTMCPDCDMDYCQVCLKPCPHCGLDFCPKCLKTGRCLDCQQKEKDADDESPEDEFKTSTPDQTSANNSNHEAPLQPICVGEALVPA